MADDNELEGREPDVYMEFNQDQIVAVLGMFAAQAAGQNPRDFVARFELGTDFKDEGGLTFTAKVRMYRVQGK